MTGKHWVERGESNSGQNCAVYDSILSMRLSVQTIAWIIPEMRIFR